MRTNILTPIQPVYVPEQFWIDSVEVPQLCVGIYYNQNHADEDDKRFFRARIKQCISMKLIGGKGSSIMDVLRLGRRKHGYPQKFTAMMNGS